jgi:hypothetical protein
MGGLRRSNTGIQRYIDERRIRHKKGLIRMGIASVRGRHREIIDIEEKTGLRSYHK